MSAEGEPRNGDDDEPLSKAAGEAKLLDTLRFLEDNLLDKDDFWEQVAILRVQAQRQADQGGGQSR